MMSIELLVGKALIMKIVLFLCEFYDSVIEIQQIKVLYHFLFLKLLLFDFFLQNTIIDE